MENIMKVKKANNLKLLRQIAEEAKASKMSDEHLTKIHSQLISLSNYLKTSPTQAYLVSVIFSLSFTQRNVDIDDISGYIECNPIKLLELKSDFDFLIKNGFIVTKFKMDSSKIPLTNYSFSITENLSDAIVNNKPIVIGFTKKKPDLLSVIESINDYGTERYNDDLPTFIISTYIQRILLENKHILFFKKLNQIRLSTEEAFMFCYMCWKFMEGEQTQTLEDVANVYFDNAKHKIDFYKKIATKESPLFTHDLIEVIGNEFANKTELMLTEKSLEMFLGKDMQLFIKNEKVKNMTKAMDIKKKDLYFNEDEVGGMKRLSDSLSNNNFKLLQKRLTQKNLSVGITILFEGGPGTGKTETAFQFAKTHGRDIMHVDISQSKSMWFGESEKVVKKIFTDYEMLCRRTKVTPILLLNEADAIISKRIEGPGSGTSQTENAIQNIILEEMEKFKGILIATTNLANNFDPAFERRFLFKIHFKQPDITTKAKIWKSKLPALNIKDCQKLANEFNLSGGQIDNIIRKVVMSEVVNNTKPNINEILMFCKEELPTTKRTKLGFIV